MKKTLTRISIILFGLGIPLFSIISSKAAQSKPDPNYSIPDTSEATEIIETIEKAYDIEAESTFTLDIKKFPNVFVNDPRYPVSSETLETIRELTNNPSLETAGYLDYKTAYYSWRINATLNAEKIKEKAKQENRELTDDEIKSLVDVNGRIAPERPPSPSRSLPLTFLSVAINDDIATVVLDDGPWTLEMYLVSIDAKWYIAGVKGLIFHP